MVLKLAKEKNTMKIKRCGWWRSSSIDVAIKTSISVYEVSLRQNDLAVLKIASFPEIIYCL